MLKTATHGGMKESVLNICCDVAGPRRIVTACLYGPQVSGYADEKSPVNVLLVLSGYQPIVKTYHKSMNDGDTFVLAVDQGAFEKDVGKGWLGEFAAEKLMLPYEPVINNEYLWRQEVAVKKRILWEILESLILEYPEMSHELIIEPKYFMYETLMRRARLFPPITYRFLNMLRNDLNQRNIEIMMQGYTQALKELKDEKWLTSTNGNIKVSAKLIKAVKSRKIRVPVFLRSVQRSALLHIFSVIPKMMTPLAYDEEIYTRTHKSEEYEDLTLQLEDPKNHLLMPTPLGPVPLSDKTTIEEFVKKTVPSAKTSYVETRQIGGVLNSVYLLTLKKNHSEQKVVVKKFKDWVGFKWFPLALWSLGTKSFAVLGKSRLEREYAVNQFLHGQGLTVPKVLYISPKQSLIFKEFVEGENLAEIVKKIIETRQATEKELALIQEVGRKIAQAHRLGVAMGDCKPENIIVTREGRLCFVDLEQASRGGNQTWDIAEFLYYSGHYVSPISTSETAELITRHFIQGYMEAGGSEETVKKVASPRYTKVFSIFTPPHIILAISSLCRKTAEIKGMQNKSP